MNGVRERLAPYDSTGSRLKKGCMVRVLKMPAWLLRGLPLNEKNELKETVGKSFKVQKIDSFGYIWLSSNNGRGCVAGCHDFAMDPKDLELKSSKKNAKRHPTMPSSGRGKRRRAV